jgi:DNA-binding transcriptional MerR regulator
MASAGLSIGDLSRATGVKATTIRFYEAEGLLAPPARSEGGHRVYGRAHLDRLGFVRHARELGFGMEDVRELLRLADAAPDAPCEGADAIAPPAPGGGAGTAGAPPLARGRAGADDRLPAWLRRRMPGDRGARGPGARALRRSHPCRR